MGGGAWEGGEREGGMGSEASIARANSHLVASNLGCREAWSMLPKPVLVPKFYILETDPHERILIISCNSHDYSTSKLCTVMMSCTFMMN